MFTKLEREKYIEMKERFNDYIDFLNNDFFKREKNNIHTHYMDKTLTAIDVSSNSRLQIMIISNNSNRSPLAFIDFTSQKILTFKSNDYVNNKVKDITSKIYTSIKDDFDKAISSIFCGKKKKAKLLDMLVQANDLEAEANEMIGEINNLGTKVADLIFFSLQEKFEPDYIEDMEVKTLYLRGDDIDLTAIFISEHNISDGTNNIFGDMLKYKFCNLKEDDYID